MKKKFTKLPEGHAAGSDTFGDLCRPKGGRSQSRALELKSQASDRILQLLEKGAEADRMARADVPIKNKKQLEFLGFQKNLAESPKIVQFAYWRSKLEELRQDLASLEASHNTRKIEQFASTIKMQIQEVEKTMRDLFEEIRKERTLFSKGE